MAIIQSGINAPTLWAIDSGSNAGRVTLYDINGNPLAGLNVVQSLNNILDSLNENVTLILSGQANVSVQLISTSGILTVTFEAQIDGSNWFPITAIPLSGGSPVTTSSVDGVWFINCSGYGAVRTIVTSFTSGNTICSMVADPQERGSIANITVTGGSIGVFGTGADNTPNSNNKIPTLSARANTSNPTWTDGYMVPLSVDIAGNLRVTGSFNNSSISVPGSSPPADATYIGGSVTTVAPTYINATMNALSLTTTGLLRIDGSGVTQPISATSLPLPTGAATETTLSGVLTTTAFQARINTLGQKTMANSTPVVLASDQTAIPVSQSGTWTVQPGNTANTTPWLTTINQGGNSAAVTGANALKVDGSAVTQPISGTVTANIGTTNGLALDATLTKLTITQSTALGTNTLAMVGGSVTTAAPTYTTGNINPLSLMTTGALRIDNSSWLGSTAPTVGSKTSANSIPVVIASDQGAITVTGTVTANNASVSATGAAPPASATYIGGSVTTAAPTYTTGQMDPLSLTTAGALRVDGSAVTQPISGTVTANQGGTWTVQPGNTANTTPWLITINQGGNSAAVTAGNALKVDGSAVTQPISGTVTANIGTTNGLALDTSVNGILVTQGSATAGEKGPLIQGAVTTVSPTYTTAQTSPLSLTIAGALRVDGSAVTQPVSGTVTVNQGTSPWITQDTVADGYLATIAINTSANATDFTASGTIVSLNGNVSITGQGVYTVTVSITGTWVATLVAEGQLADSTWVQIPMYQVAGSLPYPSIFSTTSNGTFAITGGGYLNIRIRSSIYTSGTVSVALDGSLSQQTVFSAQLGQWATTNQGTNSLGSILPITATLKNSINNLNVIDENALNKLDLLYARIDDLVNLLTLNGISSKPSMVRSITSSQVSFSASTTASILLQNNNARTGAIFVNDSGSTSNLFILFNPTGGEIVSVTNYSVMIKPSGYYEIPFGFAGRIDGIWNGTAGNVYITEIINGNV